jgi:serine/threonine protein kinase/Tol biopolymer transport system component
MEELENEPFVCSSRYFKKQIESLLQLIMNREEYQKMKQIFQSALDVEPAERSAFLDENCAGNTDMHREVKRLLDSFDSDYLEQPAIGKMAETVTGGELAPGQIVGRYRIEERIGAGGMGEVFRAEDTRLKRKIALKILPAALSFDEERLRRFEQEACAASALNHPNILTVHEFSAEDGTVFIASEFVKGETLRERLVGKSLELHEALDIASQVAAALNAAHESGIVHRDIKPENIMLREDGLVKVLDFGLAKLTENKNAPVDSEGETVARVNTTPGLVMGTPAYMSPEQARGLPTDARSDIWSLGVVLHEMISGRQPFAGETPSDKIVSILTGEAEPLGENTPPELDRVVRKALQKNRDKRYKTIKDFLVDLKEIRSDLEFQNKLDHSFEPVKSETKTKLYQETGATIARTMDEAPPQHTFQTFTARYSFLFQLAFAALVISILGVSIWWFAFGRGKQTAATDPTSVGLFKPYQITNWASTAGELFTTAAFSPDGKFIAFGSTKSGTNCIWVRQANTGDAIQVTKDEFYNRFPVFSPNGEEIVYYSNRSDSHGFWRVSLMGGQPKLVTEKVDQEAQPRLWSRSGKIYFQNYFNLFAADAESGEVSRITDFPTSGTSKKTIDISADESQIAFVTFENESWKIMVKPANGPETRQILDSKTPIENVVFDPDGRRLLFSRLTEEFYQIYSVGLDGGEPLQISSGENDAFVQDISADGERILFSSATETADLWKIDKEDAKESPAALQIDGELWADVSPAGDAIVYQSVRNLRGGSNLFNGSIIRQTVSKDGDPLRLAEDGFLPQWSPDGETVAFLKLVGRHYEIWKVAKTGDLLMRISTGEIQPLEFSLSPYLTSQVKHLSWSPKGSGLAFPAKKEGFSNIWLASPDGSGERKLSDNQDESQHLFCPIWAPDESGIVFSSRTIKLNPVRKGKHFLWFYDITTNTQRKILESEDRIRLLGLTKSGDEIIFAVTDKSNKAIPIRAVSVKTGKVRSMTNLKEPYFYNIYLSPNKDSIGFTSRSGGSDNIWVAPLEGGEARMLTGNNDPRLYFSSLAWSPDGRTIYFGKQTRFTLLSMLINQKTMEEKNEKPN